MAVTLSKLCANVNKTYNMKILAEHKGLDNVVRWVHIIEDIEVSDFLYGNELVFTTGIGQHGTDWLLPFVQNLHKSNAVGIVINTGPYIKDIPPQLIVWCEENSFPLFALPWNVHIIDVTYDFCHRIVHNEENEISLASAFKTLIYTPENIEECSKILERAGFSNNSSYRIMAMKLTIKGKNIDENLWRSTQYTLHRILKKSNDIFNILNDLDGEVHSGISEDGIEHSSIPLLYKQAISSLELAQIYNKSIKCYDDIGIFKLLFGINYTHILKDFYKSTLEPLVIYDNENNTDYTQVLKCYLHNNSSVNAVASVGYYKEANILYNVNKVGKVLGEVLEDLKSKHKCVGDVRYIGLFSGIELVKDKSTKEPLVPYGQDPTGIMSKIVKELSNKGFATYSHENVIIVTPPLIITAEQVREEIVKMDEVLTNIDATL